MLTSSHSWSTCAPAPMSLAPAATLLTTTAWSPKAELTVGDWVRQGRWLGALSRGSGWWIGDWVRYGNARYGERYSAAARVTGYDLQTLRNMAFVAGRFEPSRRRDALSFSHHAELAGLPPDEQELWLDRAEASALSLRCLRSELGQARRRARSREAFAEERRQANHPATSAGSNGATFPETLEAPTFAADPRNAQGTAVSPRPASDGSALSGAVFELECPECGCRFASSAHPEGAVERERSNNTYAPRARLAPPAPAARSGA
jgi:hypothetical protein